MNNSTPDVVIDVDIEEQEFQQTHINAVRLKQLDTRTSGLSNGSAQPFFTTLVMIYHKVRI